MTLAQLGDSTLLIDGDEFEERPIRGRTGERGHGLVRRRMIEHDCLVHGARGFGGARDVGEHRGRRLACACDRRERLRLLRRERRACGLSDLRLGGGAQRDQDFEQLNLRERQKAARRHQTRLRRRSAADNGLHNRICGRGVCAH